MADFAITADQVGAYELAVPAGQPVEVAVHSNGRYRRPQLQVIHHGGAAPVYVGVDGPVEPRDPAAVMVMPASYAEINAPVDGFLWLVTDAPATVSVARS